MSQVDNVTPAAAAAAASAAAATAAAAADGQQTVWCDGSGGYAILLG
jgi:hypothetical protein